MLRFRSSCNGVKHLVFMQCFRQLAFYSVSISTEINTDFVNYLVDTLGFSRQHALLTSAKFTRNRLTRGAKKVSIHVQNADSVVSFLKNIGLEQHHIRNAISFNPQILMSNVVKTLTPKAEFFNKLGFSRSDIADVISVNPSIFLMALNTTIVPAIQILREIMGSDRDVISILKKYRCPKLSVIPKFMVPNVALLRSYGAPIQSIRKFLLRRPSSFLIKTECLQDAITRVEENLGIPRSSVCFLTGVVVLTSSKEVNIESKKQIYKSFGWTDSDIASLVLLNPTFLALSEDSIKKKLDFLMNELGYEPSYLASRCNLFTCSLEKRVVPRHKVLSVLKKNGTISMNYALSTAVSYSESRFLNKLVLPFKEVHELYSHLTGVSLDMLTHGSSKSNG